MKIQQRFEDLVVLADASMYKPGKMNLDVFAVTTEFQ